MIENRVGELHRLCRCDVAVAAAGLDLAVVVDVEEGARVDRGVEPFSTLLLQLQLLPMFRPVSVAKEVSFTPAKLP